MVSPGGLGKEGLVLRELFLVGERYTVNSLKGIIVLITQEVRSRVLGLGCSQQIYSSPAAHLRMHLCDHEGLDLARMWDVRTNTQVDHGSTTVNCGGGAVGYLGFNDVLLVFVILTIRDEIQGFVHNLID